MDLFLGIVCIYACHVVLSGINIPEFAGKSGSFGPECVHKCTGMYIRIRIKDQLVCGLTTS